jgi:hypothetical protein
VEDFLLTFSHTYAGVTSTFLLKNLNTLTRSVEAVHM